MPQLSRLTAYPLANNAQAVTLALPARAGSFYAPLPSLPDAADGRGDSMRPTLGRQLCCRTVVQVDPSSRKLIILRRAHSERTMSSGASNIAIIPTGRECRGPRIAGQ